MAHSVALLLPRKDLALKSLEAKFKCMSLVSFVLLCVTIFKMFTGNMFTLYISLIFYSTSFGLYFFLLCIIFKSEN